MLAKRILTAVLGIIAASYIINFGQWLFWTAVLLFALISWLELTTMLRQKDIKIANNLGIISILLIHGCAIYGNPQETVAIMFVFLMIVFAKTIWYCPVFTVLDAVFTFAGLIYIGLAYHYLILLRAIDSSVYINTWLGSVSTGAAYVWLAFIGTWSSDTFAFFVGSKLGKHKLCSTISPAKTVEGAVGGFIGSIIGVVLAGFVFHFSLIHSIAIGGLVGVTAPMGDLVESALKRFAGVKDSGNILPGHGGILDRFDSILFAAPTVYFYLQIFIIH